MFNHAEVAENKGIAAAGFGGNDEASATRVLRELFDLLETYAPGWYTQEHHNRATSVLSAK